MVGMYSQCWPLDVNPKAIPDVVPVRESRIKTTYIYIYIEGIVPIRNSRIKTVSGDHLGAVGLKSNGPKIFFFFLLAAPGEAHHMQPMLAFEFTSKGYLNRVYTMS